MKNIVRKLIVGAVFIAVTASVIFPDSATAGQFDGVWEGELTPTPGAHCGFRVRNVQISITDNNISAVWLSYRENKVIFNGDIFDGNQFKLRGKRSWYIKQDNSGSNLQQYVAATISGKILDRVIQGKLSSTTTVWRGSECQGSFQLAYLKPLDPTVAKRPEEEAKVAKVEKSTPPPLPTPKAKASQPPIIAAPDIAANVDGTFPTLPIDVQFKEARSNPDDIAVIIGNANYRKLGRDIPNVTPAYADSAGIKKYFTQALGVAERNIIHIKHATGTQLIGVFGNERSYRGKLFNWVKPGLSNIYVYYAGHGAPVGEEGNAFMVPSDASVDTIDLTGYPLATLYKNLGKIPAKSITVILEACFSGSSQGGAVISYASPVFIKAKIPTIPPNVTVISAGGANQMASWERDKSHSLFTKYFLKGMSGEADAKPYGNADDKVDYAELQKYLDGTMTYFARRYYGRNQNAEIVNGG